ncbi:MAG: GFA family protein [Burkholderiales bacterium]
MRVHGSCHCGRIVYEADVDPQQVTICHCTDCQMLTGTAYRVNVQAPAETFRLLSGTPKRYVKTADSGNKRRHYFCPDCGTPVCATADSDTPPTYGLRVGCLKERALLPPKQRIWCRSALAWAQDLGAIPGKDAQ